MWPIIFQAFNARSCSQHHTSCGTTVRLLFPNNNSSIGLRSGLGLPDTCKDWRRSTASCCRAYFLVLPSSFFDRHHVYLAYASRHSATHSDRKLPDIIQGSMDSISYGIPTCGSRLRYPDSRVSSEIDESLSICTLSDWLLFTIFPRPRTARDCLRFGCCE